ncbi:DUF6328 family protein [Archangium sp.]|uniref:DUF6328 family protein n=1 Tax=Archangium sp. TaxID=1872627 RepID=UPI00389B0D43
MAELKSKVQNALDEARILILGTQVLIGFGFRVVFEEGFPKLPVASQHLLLVDLGLLLLTFALLVTPGAWHRIVERGEDTPRFHRTVTRLMWPALLPISAALGINLFVAGEKVLGRTGGLALGLGGGVVSLGLLYGLESVQRRRFAPDIQRRQAMAQAEQSEGKTKVEDKIRHVLTESRVVLPGAQALMGFQFATMLMKPFDELPASSKLVHLGSLALVALSVILLLTPAAWHRIVEQGEETERFHRFASRTVLASLVPLALGLSGDLYVVVRKVLGSVPLAVASALACLAVCYGLWFGLTLARRARRASRTTPPPRGSRTVPA